MYQTRMRSSFLKDFLDPFFFSERFLTDELNGQTIGFGQCFGILPDLFAKRLSELEIVEDPDVVGIQIRSDVLVEELVLVDTKAVTKYDDIFEAQMLTYLRLTGLKLGMVINFGQRLLKDGIHRVVNGL